MLLYHPDKRYPFWKLATAGASDFKMPYKNSLGDRNEYMLFVDPSENLEDRSVALRYHRVLMEAALYPAQDNAFVSYGHDLLFDPKFDPAVEGVYYEMPQAVEDTGILRCKLSLFRKAICLQVVPLDKPALDALQKLGNQDFSFEYAYPEGEGQPHWLCKL